MARAGAWSRPSVIPRLRCLRSIGLEDYDKGSKMTKCGRRLRRSPLPHIDIDEFVPKLSLGIVLFEQLSKISQSLDQGLQMRWRHLIQIFRAVLEVPPNWFELRVAGSSGTPGNRLSPGPEIVSERLFYPYQNLNGPPICKQEVGAHFLRKIADVPRPSFRLLPGEWFRRWDGWREMADAGSPPARRKRGLRCFPPNRCGHR
jgi:hypothetical protein